MVNYKCADCGNNNQFRRTDNIKKSVTEWGKEERIINNEGDIHDYLDFDLIDSDVIDEETEEYGDEITCNNCGSSNIVDLEDEYEVEVNELKQELIDLKNKLRGLKND
jgi:DNA-directed RNA polymerase subunit RPC12/RpoP